MRRATRRNTPPARLSDSFRYNLIFLLTGGGRFNFAGAKHWLAHADARIVDAVDAAICLDAIGGGEELFLHVSRATKDPQAAELYSVRGGGWCANVLQQPIADVHPLATLTPPPSCSKPLRRSAGSR